MQILVMEDGETWGGVEGAYVMEITEAQHDRLCEGDNISCIDEEWDNWETDNAFSGGEHVLIEDLLKREPL